MRTVRFALRCLLVLALSFLGVTSLAFPATMTTTSLSITASGSAATTLSSGAVVALTATVNSGATPVTPGQVNFCDATAVVCTDIHLLGTAQLTSAGTAVIKFVPGVGNHSYKAVFVGTNIYTASSSIESTLTVTSSRVYPSSTTIASSGNPGNYTLTATVVGAGSSASAGPTGLVSFLDTSNAGFTVGTASLGAATTGLAFLNPSTVPVSGAFASSAVGDFNGDGKVDLALVDHSGDPISVLLGNGDGTFTAGSSVTASPSGAYTLAVGDFNGDGKTDLVVESFGATSGSNSSVTALLGNGDGTFTAAASSVIAAPPGQVAVGDLNNDGKQDLAIVAGTTIAILLGSGDGTFTAAAAISADAGVTAIPSLVVGDFNGDGKADLIAAGQTAPPMPFQNAADSPLMVLLGNGDGTFTAGPSLTTCCEAAYVASGDFNGDGKADLVVTERGNFEATEATLLLGNGDGTFAEPQTSDIYDYGTGSVSIGDFNGDGYADLAIDGGISILLGNGAGTFVLDTSLPVPAYASFLTIGDFDGSGTSNLALYLGNANGTSIYLTQPTQTATAVVNGVSPAGPGTHQVDASYPGDGRYSGSVSTPAGLTGTPTAAITFSVSNHTYGDAPFTVAATSTSTGAFTYSVVSGPAKIVGSTVTLTSSGSVVLQASQAAADNYDASTQTASFVIAPASLSITANNFVRVFGAANPTFTGTVVGAVNGDTFSETFSTPANPAIIVGTYTITPSVTGANLASYNVSALNGTLTVSQAGTATTFALSNQNTTLTATVASLTSGMPTGTVAFYEGQTQIGAGTLIDGTASYTASTFPAGDVLVSAQYSGDGDFTQSNSPPILVLSVTPANTSLTVASAGSVTDAESLVPAPGYVGTVQLSCAGLPANASCSFQPSSVAFSGTDTATKVIVTIQTGVASQARLQSPRPAGDGGRNGIFLAVVWFPGVFTGMALGHGGRTRRSRINQVVILLLLLCGLCAGLGACGAASTSITSHSSSSTPTGTYTVQLITAGASGTSQTVAVTLTVQ